MNISCAAFTLGLPAKAAPVILHSGNNVGPGAQAMVLGPSLLVICSCVPLVKSSGLFSNFPFLICKMGVLEEPIPALPF